MASNHARRATVSVYEEGKQKAKKTVSSGPQSKRWRKRSTKLSSSFVPVCVGCIGSRCHAGLDGSERYAGRMSRAEELALAVHIVDVEGEVPALGDAAHAKLEPRPHALLVGVFWQSFEVDKSNSSSPTCWTDAQLPPSKDASNMTPSRGRSRVCAAARAAVTLLRASGGWPRW